MSAQRKALRPCAVPGCPEIAVKGGRCVRHATEWARNVDSRRPSARERGYGSDWRRRRAEVLRACPYCMQCGALATVVDHIIPLRAGGSSDASNLQPLCQTCHNKKTTTRDGGGWRRR